GGGDGAGGAPPPLQAAARSARSREAGAHAEAAGGKARRTARRAPARASARAGSGAECGCGGAGGGVSRFTSIGQTHMSKTAKGDILNRGRGGVAFARNRNMEPGHPLTLPRGALLPSRRGTSATLRLRSTQAPRTFVFCNAGLGYSRTGSRAELFGEGDSSVVARLRTSDCRRRVPRRPVCARLTLG